MQPLLKFVLFIIPITVSCKSSKIEQPFPDNEILGRIIDANDIITIDKFIGANGFIDDPIENLKAVGFIREYHDWGWDEGNGDVNYPGFPNNQIKFAPSNPGWNYDEYYSKLKEQGIEVSPCIQGSPGWLSPQNNIPFNNKPIDNPDSDPADPESYYKKSKFMFQFAARYGSQKVPKNELALAPDQVKASGLGLIRYIEDWNEQDKTWEGEGAQFSPEEYAAMASANYDGHNNTLNKISGKYGIKNADPSLKLVMGGLASLDLSYIKRMKIWFENNRKDMKFVPDVLNFHIYAFKDGKSWQGGGPALSPEDARFKEKLSEIVRYRNQNLPDKEIWVSEFGWDTNPHSVLAPPPIGTMDVQEVQAIWLVRAYLAFAAAGVDRAQMYMTRDVDPNNKTWFASSGLTGPKGDFTKKKSWYYIYNLKNILTNMRYVGAENATDSNILIYKFQDIYSTKGVYVVWAKTSEDYKVSNYALPVSSAVKNAQLTTMISDSNEGKKQNLAIDKGMIYFDVSEKPVFITVDNMN